MIHEGSSVVITTDQVSCEMQGELLILQTASGIYFGLDPVGKRVWTLMQQPQRVSDIRDVLLTEYEVDREICTRDLLSLLETLASKRLIEVRLAPMA